MSSYPNSICEAHTNVRTNEPACLICMHAEIESLRAERDALLADAERFRFYVDARGMDLVLTIMANDLDNDKREPMSLDEWRSLIDRAIEQAGHGAITAPQANEQEQADER